MKYRDFGATGLEVSELVFGGGAVGGLLINQDDETKRKAIARALGSGISWIDTAPSYGQGRSEEALGRLLAEVDKQPCLSTKFTIDTRKLGDLKGQIERSLEQSLERLERDSVTLLQLHNQIGRKTSGRMIAASELLKEGGVFDCLEQLEEAGSIGHYGITALGEPGAIIEVLESGRPASAQVYYNLLNPSAGMAVPAAWPVYDFRQLLDVCARKQIAAMNIRVFSAGVIATDNRTGRERPLTAGDTVESETAKANAMFREIGTSYGSRAQTAIRFALTQPGLSCVIFGLAEIAHLEEAITAQEVGRLPDEAIERIRGVYEKGVAKA